MKTAPHLQSSSIILIIVYMCMGHHLGVQETTLASALQLNNQTDKLALLALKDRILEDPLMVMSSWNETLHFCEWRGVSCSRQHEGRVITLNLAGQHLVGSVPPHIGNLTFLRHMDLNSNMFNGEIPQEVGHLFRLRYLNLSDNAFQGKIPSNLGFCSNLQVISLNGNNLEGEIPDELRNLSKQLVSFSISRNYHITGRIPRWLGNASSLIKLSLKDNKLHGSITAELGRLSKLQFLQLTSNHLSGMIPSSIYNLSSLEILCMAENQLHGEIPWDIGTTLPNVQMIYLGLNHFSGPIPVSLANASKLEWFSIGYNNLSGAIPSTLGSLRSLKELHIPGNNLEVEGLNFLTSLTNNSDLYSLDLGCNLFKAELPASIANFSSKLEYLYIDHNQISGNIPKEIGNLIGLRALELDVNHIGELSQATSEFSSSNLIGKGSFGSVYKGIMGRDGMSLAVKVLHLEQKGAFKSFMAECGALRNIRHRNVIKIVSVCSSADYKGAEFKAIIYEFMQNGSLEGWLHPNEVAVKVKNLNFIQRLNIAIEVGSATEYLHYDCQPAIVHGDLKPSNVLLDHDMVAHVADFGLSRFQSKCIHNNASKKQSSSMGVRGTVGYVAPEYGMGGKASISGDVYSFGIMLLEMVTGKRPTDLMFKDCFTIHQFTKAALPENAMDILEPSLLQEVYDAEKLGNNARRVGVLECIIAVARVGVICSMESPKERIEMKKAVAELCAIKQELLGSKWRLLSILTEVEDDVVRELVPLEGEEEGMGSFLGSICCQLGNLDASERTKKARRVKSKHLSLQEPNMMNTDSQEIPWRAHLFNFHR
ncbi:hypothetical protein SLEP1_g2130 [Rubroshorea leprosula]|uniref:non-specific serine/threonine protein kinase n=1 Tax=Rubroshorea leprosula TaxID=152421 RepID=A0AAV5HRH9_9ROSI|nr:hypothetical protein SLEP1_g2130 [Rubroshorea leprosula]